MKNRAVVYARFSSDRQNEASIDDQLRAAHEFARENNLKIIKAYTDYAMTGTNDKREEFQRLMKDAEKDKFDYVVIWNTDRLHRNMFNAFRTMGDLNDYGVSLLSITQPELNNGDESTLLLTAFYSWKDQRYSTDLSKNVKRGMRSKAEKCLYMGYKVYGYDHDSSDHFIVNKREAEIVRTCYTEYLQGSTILEITEGLNRRGYRTPKGNPFNFNFVERTLKRDVYIGHYYYKGELISTTGYPRIIDDETYCQVQTKLGLRKGRGVNADYVLTGKLYCGICEKPLRGVSGTAKSGKTHYYYVCGGKKTTCATGKSIRKEWLEGEVVAAIRDTFSEPERLSQLIEHLTMVQEATAAKPEVEIARERLQDIEKKQERLLKAYLAGTIDEALHEKEAADLNVQKLGTELEIRRLGSREELLVKEDFTEFFDDLSKGKISERLIIDNFISKVVLYEDKIAVVTRLSGVDPSLAEIDRSIKERTPSSKGGSYQDSLAGSQGFEPR